MSARSRQDDLAKEILSVLPEDGTPILNRVLRVILARNLERPVSEESFFEARDALVDTGVVGRLRGQGGQSFLLKETSRSAQVRIATEVWPESSLMEPLRQYLEGPFRKNLDLPNDAACIVQDTSVMGGHKGKWARPDFILVSAMRFRLMPGSQVDLHSFELKTESGGSVLAIHEALAQTRFTHFGHFVWHLPEGSKNEAMLDDIITHCEEHGIGLIRMFEPRTPDTCEILADPRRKPTFSSVVDGFLESKLGGEQRKAILKATR